MPKVGNKAPDFTAVTDEGKKIKLKDFRGKTVILYFYPKDNTPGCTQEACDFRDAMNTFRRKGAVVLGLSPDGVKSHEKFKAKHDLPFPLLADEDHQIAEKYGVWKEKSMYGRKFMGIERTTFVIGPDGKIAYISEKVKVKGHVAELLEKAQQASGRRPLWKRSPRFPRNKYSQVLIPGGRETGLAVSRGQPACGLFALETSEAAEPARSAWRG